MKFLALFALVAFSSTSYAFPQNDKLSAELLKLLIENAAQIKLVDSSDGSNAGDVANVLAQALAAETLKPPGKEVNLRSVSSNCKSTGSLKYTCSLSILDGTYAVTQDGYQGPDTESSISLILEISSNGAHPYVTLKLRSKTVQVVRAG